jgi:tetratricopeptide (TPR) repeat protein
VDEQHRPELDEQPAPDVEIEQQMIEQNVYNYQPKNRQNRIQRLWCKRGGIRTEPKRCGHCVDFRIRVGNAVLSAFLGATALTACAQSNTQVPSIRDPFNGPNSPQGAVTYGFQGAVFMLNVFTETHSPLDRQALVKLQNKTTSGIMWQTTQDRVRATFYDLPVGTYEAEITAVGYLPSHVEVSILGGLRTYQSEVLLKKDPQARELEIPSHLSLPPKAKKRISRAITDLRSGDLRHAEKELERATKLVPDNPELNYLLAYAEVERQNLPRAHAFLERALAKDAQHLQALTLLGEVEIKQKEYASARDTLERVVIADPQLWRAHYLLAEACLRLGDFRKAREQAEAAIEKGKSRAVITKVVLGEALANLGDKQGAMQALTSFLQDQPESPLSAQVRSLQAELQSVDTVRIVEIQEVPENVRDLSGTQLSLERWGPPEVDEMKPPLASGITCPAQEVIRAAGKQVKRLTDDISRFAATESVVHEEFDKFGAPTRKVERNFNYVASISEIRPGVLSVDEDRMLRSNTDAFPDQIVTLGLPTLALIFHPLFRDDYEMTCEGLGEWQDQPTWLVHFQQRADRPRRIKGYVIGREIYPVALKGRAWIRADKYQIVRIESELVEPMPRIQLRSDHEIVEYGAVQFPRKNTELWLPKRADLYFDFRHRHYFRRHSFDHFMLFAVDSEDKVVQPRNKPN